MRMKMIATMASAALLMASNASVAQASSAKALSVKSSAQTLSISNAAGSRAPTTNGKSNKQFGISPLFFILGIVGVVAILEITGAIDIFSDEPTSP